MIINSSQGSPRKGGAVLRAGDGEIDPTPIGSGTHGTKITKTIPLFLQAGRIQSSIPLYEGGYAVKSGSFPLYTRSTGSISSSINLQINGSLTASGGTPLYTSGYDRKSSNIPLFTKGSEKYTDGIPLFTSGKGVIAHAVTLTLHGKDNKNSAITMFTSGKEKLSLQTTLFVQGKGKQSTTTTLYMNGSDGGMSGIDASIPLFMFSTENVSNNIPMFIGGHGKVFGGMLLYLQPQGGVTSHLNLFLKALNPSKKTASIPLVMYGSLFGQTRSFLNLYTKGTNKKISASRDLFIKVDAKGGYSETLNMFLKSDTFGIAKAMPLFLQNSNVEYNDNIWLFIKGKGVNPGAMYYDETVNLFIQQNDISHTMSSNIPLVVSGIGVVENNTPLYVVGGINKVQASIPCTINGVIPSNIQSNINLVMPNTSDSLTKSINLYTHGFDRTIGPGV